MVLSRQDGERWLRLTASDDAEWMKASDEHGSTGRHFRDYDEMCKVMGTDLSPVESILGHQRGPSAMQFMLWYSGMDKDTDASTCGHLLKPGRNTFVSMIIAEQGRPIQNKWVGPLQNTGK